MRNGSRGPPRPRGPPGQKNLFDSPERSENRRPRRNSESSMIDKGSLNPEEERKRRERRKEREAKDGKSRSGRSKRPNGLDLIDKLDVTGIYGPGRECTAPVLRLTSADIRLSIPSRRTLRCLQSSP